VRHPRELGVREVEAFLTHLAVKGKVAASTQNQALSALLFLYKQVLEIELPLVNAVRAKRGERLPVVLSVAEVRRVISMIPPGINRLKSLAPERQGKRKRGQDSIRRFRIASPRALTGGLAPDRYLCE